MFAIKHSQSSVASLLLSLSACHFEASLPSDTSQGTAHATAGSGTAFEPRAHAGGAGQAALATPGHAADGVDPVEPTPEAHDAEWDVGDDAAGGGGSVPGALVGSWYASSGGTSIPYDPVSGTFGMQNGSGLLYRFLEDGSYQKAFQSYASNAGCTTGFHAEESGSMQVSQDSLLLVPDGGEIHYRDNCSPSLDSDKPEDGLAPEQFTWQLTGDGLRLIRSDGVSSVFVRTNQ